MNPTKIVKFKRLNQDLATLEVERYFENPENGGEMEYSYDQDKKSEKYVFFLSIDELYSITREAIRASSEVIQVKKPGSY